MRSMPIHGPGNVREMENYVKRAVIMAEGAHIAAADLGLEAAHEKSEPLNLRQVRDERSAWRSSRC